MDLPVFTIESISYVNEQRIILNLAFNGTDFDVNYPNFRISISEDILVQSSINLLTNTMPINANIEPVVQNVIIPNMTMKSGDQVTATIECRE